MTELKMHNCNKNRSGYFEEKKTHQTVEPVVRVGVGCFVKCQTDQGVRILIGRRKGSHGAGHYQLPGGHLEFGETFDECARREVLEETNLVIDNVQFITATNDIMADEHKHYVTVFMQGTAKDASRLKTMEPEKLDGDWAWITAEDIQNYTPLFTPLTNLLKLPFYQDDVLNKLSTF